MARSVAKNSPAPVDERPVVFFRASTGLLHMSQNTAFPLLISWALRLAGVRVLHFACRAGMSRCVQGTNKDDYYLSPPCEACVAHSRRLFAYSSTKGFTFSRDKDLESILCNLDVEALSSFEYHGLPLGSLVLPAFRWILRRHNLTDDEPTRFLFREYILSADWIAQEFSRLVEQTNPRAIVVFNGMFFPEATVRWIAMQKGLRVISHEVGFRPHSVFLTEGDATAYPIDIPVDFTLSEQQNSRLDTYLEGRFKGNFTMAGIRFWPEMHGLDEILIRKIDEFRQVISVFTNVVFDTSQVHANTIFPHMFAWLDMILSLIRSHPEILFVIRAHPDEMRLNKASRESVHDWVFQNHVLDLSNVVFIDSHEYISSYELIQRSKFVMVYNSSIGLEAAIMGAAVLCGGKARFTQYPIVFYPQTSEAYKEQAEVYLRDERVDIPLEFQVNARRFLYYHLYKVSLPFDEFIESQIQPGFVRLRSFSWRKLLPETSPIFQVITNGILAGIPFVLDEN